MTRQVLDVGNCDYDHNAIATLLQSSFDVRLARAHTMADALAAIEQQSFDLVLVNRRMDRDGSEGMDLIQSIRQDPRWDHLPVMMITNLPDQQQRAIEAGAAPGFGKASLKEATTVAMLRDYLA